jgi:plastocyanin
MAVAVHAAAGDLAGHVIMTRKLTKRTIAPTVYNLRGSGAVTASGEPKQTTEFDRTIVFLEGGKLPVPAPVKAVIEQRDTRFEPDMVVIPKGSIVRFPNFDPIFHNIFSLSVAQPFDLGYYPKSQSRSVVFNKTGIVQIYCHIHSQMYAGIVVTDSPYSARPDGDGSFSFAKVPAGHYRLMAWHKFGGLHSVEVDVPESGPVEVQIRVPVDTEKRW